MAMKPGQIFLIFAVIGLCMAGNAQIENKVISDSPQQAESEYMKTSDAIWSQFWQELSFSSFVLDRYVSGNMTAEDAFTRTISAYILCSDTVAAANSVQPPEKYRDLHSLTLSSLINLQAYLWNQAKYYETTSIGYWNLDRYQETGSKQYLNQVNAYNNLSEGYYQSMQDYFNQTVNLIDRTKKERIKVVEFNISS
jgi:hypothetical protein